MEAALHANPLPLDEVQMEGVRCEVYVWSVQPFLRTPRLFHHISDVSHPTHSAHMPPSIFMIPRET